MAYLAVTGNPVGKEKLAELLWQDAQPQRARESLNKVCAYLKKLKENHVPELPLSIRRDELYLDLKDIFCDVREFRRLSGEDMKVSGWEEAVSLYTAPLLYENYYDWSVMEEAYYDVRYGELLEKLAEHYQMEGRKDMASLYERKLEDFR